jgi:integrase/recombinase XerD
VKSGLVPVAAGWAEWGNSIITRNNRLAPLHSLFSYAALRCPEHAALISRVLAIPSKRARLTQCHLA